jgi:uncharacterized membrane protein
MSGMAAPFAVPVGSPCPFKEKRAMSMTSSTPVNRISQLSTSPDLNEPAVNVSDSERWISVLGGGALAILGLSRDSWLGLGLAALGGALAYRGVSGHCSLYQALDINTSGKHQGRATSVDAGAGVKVEQSITINRSPGDLFSFWRNVENLPLVMSHLESVKRTGPGISRWVARGPLGKAVEWEAQIFNERPNELISWRSLQGSEVDTAGSVHFQPAHDGRGTEIRVALKYNPPLGKIGASVAWLFGRSAEKEIEADLLRLKEAMERGEMPTRRQTTR